MDNAKTSGDSTQLTQEKQNGPKRSRRLWWLVLPIALVAWFGIAQLRANADKAARQTAFRTASWSNAKNVGLAMQNYAAQHNGDLPVVVSKSADGQPLHSWRAQILPFLDQKMLHEQIDWDAAWNSPENKKLSETELTVFHSVGTSNDAPNRTNWFVITGDETPFPETGTVSLDQISDNDGMTQTLMFTEAVGMGVSWIEPKDIPYDALTKSPKDLKGVGPSTDRADGGVVVIFTDGHIKALSADIDPAVLRALAGWNDGIITNQSEF